MKINNFDSLMCSDTWIKYIIGGKAPQLLIIAQVFGHTASKRRHCSAFELKNQVIKTFLRLLKFIFNVGKV